LLGFRLTQGAEHAQGAELLGRACEVSSRAGQVSGAARYASQPEIAPGGLLGPGSAILWAMRHRTRTWLLAVLVLVWAGVVAADELLVPVLQVIDGDTIAVRYRGQRELVRYTGINAPETNHPTKGEEPGGREATEFNRRLVDDHRVRLELDVQVRDRYGGPRGGQTTAIVGESERGGWP